MGRQSKVKVQRSFLLRALNWQGRLVELFRGRKRFEVAALEATAVEQTKLTDFGGTEYRPGLEAYVEALNREVSLHPVGRMLTEQMTAGRLCTLLSTADALKQHPCLSEPTLDCPLFVVGTPRSGTTFLYNLLSLDPHYRTPAFWEGVDPMPPASVVSGEEIDRRIFTVQSQNVAGYNKLLPSHRQIHHIQNATQREECFPLMESTFCFTSLGILWSHLPSYLTWLDSQPHSAFVQAYAYFRRILQALMYKHEGRRWLSKSPLHACHLTALADVFPDARIVHLHRDPSQAIPSGASLLRTWQSLFLASMPPPEFYGRLAVWYYSRATDGIKAARDTVLGPNTHDLEYEELVRDPVATVAKLYDSYNLAFTSEFESAMRTWLEHRNDWSPKKVGVHRYTATDFGLDPQQLRSLAS